MNRAGRGRGVRPQGGFALVGVVMFILVLTILGLSLFSLSSFESQFLYNSNDRSQCFFAAMGGLERAKWVLASKDSLVNVGANLPRDSVVYAEARQGSIDWESARATGEVAWNGDPVWVRVLATVGTTSRMYEARFNPVRPMDIYRNLMALWADNHPLRVVRFEIDPADSTQPPRYTQTDLIGDIVQASNDLTAGAVGQGSFPLNFHIDQPVPRLEGAAIVDYQQRIATQAVAMPAPSNSSSLDLPRDASNQSWPNNVALIKTMGYDGLSSWGVDWTQGEPRIRVSGTVIWFIERGLKVKERLEIFDSPGGEPDFLVIVARPNSGSTYEEVGILFEKGVDSPNVPLILVSNERVEIRHLTGVGETNVAHMTIYARRALIMGPRDPNPLQNPLEHPRLRLAYQGLPPQHDAILDKLYQLRLLPNTEDGLGPQLKPLAGTWHEMTSYSAPN